MNQFTNITIFALWLASASWSLGNISIERVEYFVGEDPGHGNATELEIPAGETSFEGALVFPPGSLPDAPRSQITIRALDSEGNWSPPAHIAATTPLRPADSGRTLAGAEVFLSGSASAADGSQLPVQAGQTVADAEIELPYGSLPEQGSAGGWIQAEDSDGFRGPPVPFRAVVPPPDRFAGQDIFGVGAWHYSILDGSEVVAMGTSGVDDDLVSGFDFRELLLARDYSLILKPTAASGLPFLTAATEIDVIPDFEWWQRRHFTDAERDDDEISGPGADPDGSGTTNFERFVGGSAPGEAFGGLRTGFELVPDGETHRPLVTLERSRLATSTTFVLEASENLQSWEEVSAYDIDISEIDAKTDRLEIRPEGIPEPAPDNHFYRFRVFQP